MICNIKYLLNMNDTTYIYMYNANMWKCNANIYSLGLQGLRLT